MPNLVLATASPRRIELLDQLGFEFSVMPQNIDESLRLSESANIYVKRMSKTKASGDFASDSVVLAADTIVVAGQEIMGKPRDFDDARRMLRRLSASTHSVLTSVTIREADAQEHCLVSTEVSFCALTDADINWYWATGEPADKAGSYGIQGLGGVFVDRIHGSYSNVVGLPLCETVQLLKKFGIKLPGKD